MQLTKIQKQIENNPWKTAITIRKNNQTIFETSNANMVFKSASLIKLGLLFILKKKSLIQLTILLTYLVMILLEELALSIG